MFNESILIENEIIKIDRNLIMSINLFRYRFLQRIRIIQKGENAFILM